MRERDREKVKEVGERDPPHIGGYIERPERLRQFCERDRERRVTETEIEREAHSSAYEGRSLTDSSSKRSPLP